MSTVLLHHYQFYRRYYRNNTQKCQSAFCLLNMYNSLLLRWMGQPSVIFISHWQLTIGIALLSSPPHSLYAFARICSGYSTIHLRVAYFNRIVSFPLNFHYQLRTQYVYLCIYAVQFDIILGWFNRILSHSDWLYWKWWWRIRSTT